jgi:S-formylglutathione hydrolase FrmB
MKKIILLLALFVALIYGLSAQKQHVLTSKYILKADTVWVFTPANYADNAVKSFPLIYLLHGWSGSYHQWNDIMDCQKYADEYGFIIVCPDGLYDSWYINSPVIKGSQYTDFFFMDLFPFVTKAYRVDNKNVFITGLSMGGHGALYLFEQKPELFRSAGSISGVLDLTNSRNDYRISEYLGLKKDTSDEKILKAYSVVGNIEKIAASGKEIIFSCGVADPFYNVNNEFRVKCDKAKVGATYISNPGAHNYPYWKSNIGSHFDFFKSKIQSD